MLKRRLIATLAFLAGALLAWVSNIRAQSSQSGMAGTSSQFVPQHNHSSTAYGGGITAAALISGTVPNARLDPSSVPLFGDYFNRVGTALTATVDGNISSCQWLTRTGGGCGSGDSTNSFFNAVSDTRIYLGQTLSLLPRAFIQRPSGSNSLDLIYQNASNAEAGRFKVNATQGLFLVAHATQVTMQAGLDSTPSLVISSGVQINNGGPLILTTGGTLRFPDGTEQTTAGAGEQGTFGPSTKTLTGNAFSVGGSTFSVTGGKVGIGTTNPGPGFHVQGASVAIVTAGAEEAFNNTNINLGLSNTTDTGIAMRNTASNAESTWKLSGNTTQFGASMDGPLELWQNGIARIRAQVGGQVLVGSNVGTLDNAGSQLDVRGSAQFGSGAFVSTFTAAGLLQFVAGSTITAPGGLIISTATAALTQTPAMFIDSAGKVGFGAAPTAHLTVFPSGSTNKIFIGANTTDAGYNSISFNGDNSGARLGFTGGGGTDKLLYYDSPAAGGHRFRLAGAVVHTMQQNTGDFTWNNTNLPGNYFFQTDVVGNDFFIEGATGNIGIKDSSPATSLDVAAGTITVRTTGEGIILRDAAAACWAYSPNTGTGALTARSVTCP